jgi:hypothetical protein
MITQILALKRLGLGKGSRGGQTFEKQVRTSQREACWDRVTNALHTIGEVIPIQKTN